MPKSAGDGEASGYLLDHVLSLGRRLEDENVVGARMLMNCGDLEIPAGTVPIISQTPFPALVRPYVSTERSAFARFGGEQPWPEAQRPLLESLQEAVGVPVVCLKEAFVRIGLEGGACVVTVGTRASPAGPIRTGSRPQRSTTWKAWRRPAVCSSNSATPPSGGPLRPCRRRRRSFPGGISAGRAWPNVRSR